MHGHGTQLLDGFRQARPFLVVQLAGAQAALVDATDGAHDTHRQLGGAHFHREHRHRQAFRQRHMLGNVDGEGGLAHGRARRQDDQVARLHAAGHAVQVVEAARHAGDVVRVVRHLLHAIQQIDHQRIHRLEALLHAGAFFADLEDLLLGFVQNLLDRRALRVEGLGGDLVTGGDQLAQDGALAHDLGITPDVGGAGHELGQLVEVDQPADLFRLAQALQGLEHGDDVGRLGGVDQLGNGLEHQLVLMTVEVAGDEQVGHAIPGVVVQQQAAQHAGLGFDGVRRHTQLRHLPVHRFTHVVLPVILVLCHSLFPG